jgi:L,D-peptidoglycan transpeptidase YkuD (ErfK/YbiS/YcfS/YnhG family)
VRSTRPLAIVACLAMVLAGCSSPGHRVALSATPALTSPANTPSRSASASHRPTHKPTPSAHKASTAPRSSTSRAKPSTPTTPTQSAPTVGTLPLAEPTGDATEAITVVATSRQATTATLQAWTKNGGRWTRFADPVMAWLGSDGLTDHASESSTATPIGSFTLTQAFGHEANPGTALPYRQTTPADWWISESGPLYNTLQHCAGTCPFTQGGPNEHLSYALPYYRYAVVIDYNTRNAPGGVRQGAGSAFFLHVTVGQPTQGCVSIPEAALTALMRWLSPAAHPRILIGVG